jgi:putative transposase
MSSSYHITSRCNNREFRLTRLECRQIFLYILKKAIKKYDFKLYSICIMSNHIHYLIEPKKAEDIPKIMHYINWYSAMCFNRMLNRTGHFEVVAVAEKFILANCYNPDYVEEYLANYY